MVCCFIDLDLLQLLLFIIKDLIILSMIMLGNKVCIICMATSMMIIICHNYKGCGNFYEMWDNRIGIRNEYFRWKEIRCWLLYEVEAYQ